LAATEMSGGWSQHGYRLSPDGSALVLPQEEGFEVKRGAQSWKFEFVLFHGVDRELFWSPDSKRFVFHTPDERRSIGLVDLDDIGEPRTPRHKIIYSPPTGSAVHGMEWSP